MVNECERSDCEWECEYEKAETGLPASLVITCHACGVERYADSQEWDVFFRDRKDEYSSLHEDERVR